MRLLVDGSFRKYLLYKIMQPVLAECVYVYATTRDMSPSQSKCQVVSPNDLTHNTATMEKLTERNYK